MNRAQHMRGLWTAMAALLIAVPSAHAHQDPSGCFETGPAIIVSVFRANGTTGVVGAVSECETITYRATLAKASNSPTICAFSEGQFTLTLPNGNTVNIDLDVPCIGGTGGEGCDPTVTQIQSSLIPYTIDAADIVNGNVVATAQYVNGVAHDSPNNTPGVSAETPKSTPVVQCVDNDQCTEDVCIPGAQGEAACSFRTIPCTDDNLCTQDVCNPQTGACTSTPSVVCNDNDPCTTEVCNPVTGQCVPSTVVTCNDNNACTSDTCNPQTGQCVFTPVVTCTDNDPCTNDVCNPASGQCVSFPGVDCNDRDPCTDDRCDPVQGCVNEPNGLPGCLGLNHFQCYEIKPAAFERRDVTVEDRYGTATVNIKATNRLCAPSDKRGEDPTAPETPQHLAVFPSRSESFRLANQVVTNQFGTLTLDIKKRAHLMVPTAKDMFSQPGPLLNPTSHFQCYLVRRSSGSARFEPIRDLPTEDQFGPHVVHLVRPKYLCVPADKNGEDPTAPDGLENLLCYKAKQQVRLGERQPFMTNQFLTRRERMIRNLEFCVPTTFGPGD